MSEAEPDAQLDRVGVAGRRDRGRRPEAEEGQRGRRLGDRDGDAGGRVAEIDGVVDRPAHDRDRPGGPGRPGVAPVGGALAGFQVCPPSVETSTATTKAPEAALAVPVIVTGVPLGSDAPGGGQVMAEVGGVLLRAVWVAGTNPGWSVPGWAPMSANRFTVACCMLGSGSGRLSVP